MENRVRRVIEDGGLALGGLTGTFAGPTIVELMGAAGLDAALIDLEHNGLDLSQVQAMIISAEVVGITPIIRLPQLDRSLITRLLDMGAQGIQLDGIEDADEARALVDAVRFPPLGSRGLIWNSRAARYGRVDRAAFPAIANSEVLVKISIDSPRGVEEAEAIAAVEEVDIIGIGAHDLSSAYGAIGQPDHPRLREAIERVIEVVSATRRGRLALPLGSSAYPLTADDLHRLGTGYTNLQPHPEERLLKAISQQADTVRATLAAAGSAPA